MSEIILTTAALIALDTLVSLPSVNYIGNLRIDTTLEESYEDTLEVTEHPVEFGAQITDHSFKQPMHLSLRCGWSDSNPQAASVLAGQFLLGGTPNNVSGSFTGGAMVASDYVAGIYSQLLQLQESRQPLEVLTGLRKYDDMLITSLYVRRDQRTRFALRVEATLQQVILVSTQTATIPPQSSQAVPANTSAVVPAGAQQATDGSPAPGGSFPSDQWEGLGLVSR